MWPQVCVEAASGGSTCTLVLTTRCLWRLAGGVCWRLPELILSDGHAYMQLWKQRAGDARAAHAAASTSDGASGGGSNTAHGDGDSWPAKFAEAHGLGSLTDADRDAVWLLPDTSSD